jgi:hypothetical protein
MTSSRRSTHNFLQVKQDIKIGCRGLGLVAQSKYFNQLLNVLLSQLSVNMKLVIRVQDY